MEQHRPAWLSEVLALLTAIRDETRREQCATLTYREMYELLGISRAQFFRLLACGALGHLRAPVPYRFARAKVEAWINETDHRPWRATRPWRTHNGAPSD